MLGRKYNTVEEFYKRFKRIIWCTYRRNFPKLLSKIKSIEEIYTNDTGWGCMIRASQMMFSEVLRRKIKLQFKDAEELEENILSTIIDGEDSSDVAPYTIHAICHYLYEHWNTKPGQWFKASQILLALEAVHQKNQNKSFAEDLECSIFLEGTIYLDQILNKVCPEPKNEFEDISFKDYENDGLEEAKKNEEKAMSTLR